MITPRSLQKKQKRVVGSSGLLAACRKPAALLLQANSPRKR